MPILDAGMITDIEAARIENAALKTLERLQQERERALAKAIDGWAAQCGVTVEEWLKHFTCLVEEIWPDGTGGTGDSFTVTFRITPEWRDDAPSNNWKVKTMFVGDTYRNGERVR